ncbi:GNAT family N-acetyltransferase [Paenibacillus endoradicis]|uniref:GNAT family N-acetyltransferase n=1 Tax=Paenibacillus endoradicis TaxID=2972487 RepID=UPI002158F8F0|nr:GNAT family protein [Paenibacillus endoradicis]MCR8656649.1 GNAT family N-acetyltransferase [Paenibacillus endoradicis]
MRFQVLESDRLVLRQLTINDAPDLFAYLAKDEVTQFYDINNLTRIEEAETIIKYWNDKFHTFEVIRWGITLKNEDRIVGTCGFHKWIKNHHKAEIGCELSPDHWKHGYMTEALSLIIDYGFKELELNRMEALHHSENKNTRKILDKFKFQEEGILHEYFYKNQEYIDVVIHSLLKKNWNNQN